MSRIYYPYLPWSDDDIDVDTIHHDNIKHDRIIREGIYGPLAQVFRYLCAQDDLKLVADTRVLGTLETA